MSARGYDNNNIIISIVLSVFRTKWRFEIPYRARNVSTLLLLFGMKFDFCSFIYFRLQLRQLCV